MMLQVLTANLLHSFSDELTLLISLYKSLDFLIVLLVLHLWLIKRRARVVAEEQAHNDQGHMATEQEA
jgi:hypothetical protein